MRFLLRLSKVAGLREGLRTQRFSRPATALSRPIRQRPPIAPFQRLVASPFQGQFSAQVKPDRMAPRGTFFYAVKTGRSPGVYKTW